MILAAKFVSHYVMGWHETLLKVQKNYHCTYAALRVNVQSLIEGGSEIVLGPAQLCVIIQQA